jgi:hypothetical protein
MHPLFDPILICRFYLKNKFHFHLVFVEDSDAEVVYEFELDPESNEQYINIMYNANEQHIAIMPNANET